MTMLNPLWNGKHSLENYDTASHDPGSSTRLAEPSPAVEVISSWLVFKLAERLEIEAHEIDITKDLSDYGLNSVEAVNLSGDLETFLGRRLPPTLLWDYPTIEALAEYLAQEGFIDEGVTLDRSEAGSPPLPSETIPDREVSPEYYRFELSPEYRQLQRQQEEIQALGIGNPFFRAQEGLVNDRTTIGNREYINYATYNYLGMCGDPAVSQAAKQAIDRYGTSSGASRLLSGEKRLHRELEREIADFIGTEDSIVYVGGHATNVTTIGHLFGKDDLILYDALSHNSILQGCFLSGATLIGFPHNDWQALDELLRDRRHRYQRVLIAIEGVYSTDGDIPNLPAFIEVKKRHKAFLLVDEAHSIGVLGERGRGIGELFGADPAGVDLWMGTLSKSFASCGGYIAGSKAVVEYLKYTAPGFVYSVGISPPNAAATLAAIRLLKAEPERVARLHERSRFFLQLAAERKLNTGLSKGSPVIPIIVGDSLKSMQLSHYLFERGINVPFMIYPSVPKDAARLRFFITCNHTEEQIRFTVETLAAELAKL